MQLRYEQLAQHLQQKLAPIYWISGDVPLLCQEASDTLRQKARQLGYEERLIFHVETQFDWSTFHNAAYAGSLFSTRQILELRFNQNKLPESISTHLLAYRQKLPPDKLLLINSPKLDSSQLQTKWFKTLLEIAILIQLWPIENNQFPRWLQQRLANAGLNTDSAGIQVLIERTEGNLLAAMQAINLLHLQHGSGSISAETIKATIADNARFDVFNLSDSLLSGDAIRTLRILQKLQQEEIEPILVLWAITRELRTLINLAERMRQQGLSSEQVLQQQKMWPQRKPLMKAALARLSLTQLYQLLRLAHKIDKLIKGLGQGRVWLELERLVLSCSSVWRHFKVQDV